MAGIYIHIPFCKKACLYCDFHFSTQTELMEKMIQAIILEIKIRKDYLFNEKIDSIYFGGGTPSLVSKKDLSKILETIYQNFEIADKIECTLEANPDDINIEKVQDWKSIGINRLSIGIQSFFDEDLLWMGRAHDSEQAKKSIKIALENGIDKISADLIYGYNLLSNEKWESNIQTLLNSGINHLSAYNLTVEEKTVLDYRIHKGIEKMPSSQLAIDHYEILQKNLKKFSGWQQYEISNYCIDDNFAVHNSNYWKQKKYLGVGPSAHSYNRIERQWNIRNNAIYIENINANKVFYETEILSIENKFNEYVLTRLRTIWGIDLAYIKKEFGEEKLALLESKIDTEIDTKLIHKKEQIITLSKEGKLLADHLAMTLFL